MKKAIEPVELSNAEKFMVKYGKYTAIPHRDLVKIAEHIETGKQSNKVRAWAIISKYYDCSHTEYKALSLTMGVFGGKTSGVYKRRGDLIRGWYGKDVSGDE